MWFRSLFQASARPRLQVESLEDRTVPSFYAPVGYAAGNNPSAVVAADFNGDGRLDLAVANAGSNDVSILLGNGDGTFQTARSYAAGQQPGSLAVGDFNGDGKLDVVTANVSDVSVLLGNGDGTLGPSTSIDIGSAPHSVAVGDFNADGKLDLGVTSNVYYPGSPGTPGYWISTYYGDFYSPGTPGTAGDNEGRANVLLGNGDGSFSAPNTATLGYGYHTAAAVADFNGDTLPDFAAANSETGAVSVLLGDGTGALGTVADFGAGPSPSSVAAGDLNGDGKPDLVANSGSDGVSVLLGNGDGSFGQLQNYAVGWAPYSVVITDVNADGRPDLVTANYDSHDVSVLLGNGDGTFRATPNSAAGQGLLAVAAGNFNGDGRPDVAVADSYAGVSVLLNTGDWQSIQVGGFPSTTTAGQAHSLTVTALDSNGSALTSYRGTVHFTSTDAQAVLPADYTFIAADNGSHTFNATLKSNWTQSITVTDTNSSAFSDTLENIAVNPANAATFQVSEFPSPVRLGSYTMFAVEPFDAFGNLATNYRGTITLSSTDSAATFVDWYGHQLPGGSYTFTESNGGTGFFYAILNTAGPQSITATDTANLAVTGSRSGIHVNPLGTISGPTVGLRNQTLTYTLGVVSGLPTSTMFTYAIDWNGDGVTDQTVSGPSGTAVNHSYTASGGYYIGVTAIVHIGTEDFTSYSAHQSPTILPVTATIQADPGDASKSALVVDGTAGADSLILSPGTGNAIALTVNGYSVGTFSAPGGAAFAHLLVYGNGGADTIRLTGNLSVPAFLFGGDGNDVLDAGGSTANNVLVGGAGNETLVGGSGRDLLIGGLGADALRAGGGGDILIGGTTDYDTNVAALLAIMKEWGRTDADYNTRVKHLSGSLSGGLSGSYRLTTTTVHDEDTIDNLYGGAGLDWFFVGNKGKNKDKVSNQVGAEVVTNLNR